MPRPPPVPRGTAAAQPTEVTSLLRLATSLRKTGKLAESVGLMEQAARLLPKSAPLQHDIGLAKLNLGQTQAALAHFDRAIALDPRFGAAHFRRGQALEALVAVGAEDAYGRAVQLAPEMPEPHARLAALMHAQGKRGTAMSLYRAAAARSKDIQWTRLWTARAALIEDDLDTAERCAREMLAQDERAPSAHGILGYILSARGAFAEAEQVLLDGLRIRPNDVGVWFDLVQTRKLTAEDAPLMGRMQEALSLPAQPLSRLRLHLALAKAHDDTRDPAAAMESLAAADAVRTVHQPMDRAGLVALIGRVIDLFTREYLARPGHRRSDADLPLLVVGMPRSGTTLLEQILSSHSQVAGGGEMHIWASAGHRFLETASADKDADLSAAAAHALRILRGVDAQATRVVDKNPFNFVWAGLAHLVFPQARIIHIRRHPADTCLSITMASMAPQPLFSPQRDDLAFYYRQYLRLMDHFRAVLPADRFIEVWYEDLVTTPEPEIRRMIAACGLAWEDACLSPERNEKTIRTASVWQARQPISNRSAGRRVSYGPWVAPFMEFATS